MKKVIAGILLALILFPIIAMPVMALVAQPDSTPSVTIYNYRNLRETGDWLVLLDYNIPYTTPPDEPVSDTYIWTLVNGATDLGRTIGYAYNVGTYAGNGYGYGVASMYFNAANVTAQAMAWGSAYTVRLTQSPAFFASPNVYNYPVGPADYSSLVLQSAVQQELADKIINIATDLDTRWGIGGSIYSLVEEGETGTILSTYGEAYFRGTIYGVQAMAPAIFASVIEPVYYTDRTWTDNYTAQIESQYAGTWVATSKAAGAALFGTSFDLTTVIVVVIMCGILVWANITLAADFMAAAMDIGILVVFAAKLDLIPFLFALLIAALCWFYIATRIWTRIVPT